MNASELLVYGKRIEPHSLLLAYDFAWAACPLRAHHAAHGAPGTLRYKSRIIQPGDRAAVVMVVPGLVDGAVDADARATPATDAIGGILDNGGEGADRW